MSTSPIEGTDMNQIEKVARAIIGPHEPVPASSRYTLDELREVRWRQITSDERSMALREAKAAIAAMQPAPQEAVMQSERREPDANENPYSRARLNSENTKLRAEITRLTDALRAAEEREKGLREAGGRQCDNMAFVLNHFDIPGHWYGKLLAQLETDRQALAGAKP